MYYIEFRAEGQALKRVDNQIVASDSKGFLYAKFDIDAGWDGLALEAVFEQNGSKYIQVLTEGLCPVPVEVLNAGRFKVWLTGVDSNTVTRATTSSLTIDVLRGPGNDAVNASDPTPTEREEILTIATEAQRIAQSVRNDADEGKFDGAPGKEGASFEVFSEKNELDTYPATTSATKVRFIWAGEDFVYNMITLRRYGVYDCSIVSVANTRVLTNFKERIILSGGGAVDADSVKKIVEDYLAENPPESGVDTDKVNELIAKALEKYSPTIDEKDPTVPAWAKQPDKPTYTANEVGALPADTHIPSKTSDLSNDSNFITQGMTNDKINTHNASTEAHNDLRLALSELNNRLNAIADSDDVNLNQLSEIVAYIKSNKTLIDAITTNKISVSDIIDNLTTNVSNKPLSAAQGVALKALIDALSTGKLDATKLTEAINTALAQAKASGEFDGKDGTNGANGVSATHSWNGTILTITSASGTSSADLKGEKGNTGATGADGKDGYAPMRGTDYWTPSDIAEIKSYVDEAILGGAW